MLTLLPRFGETAFLGVCDLCNQEKPDCRKFYHTYTSDKTNSTSNILCRTCELVCRKIGVGVFSVEHPGIVSRLSSTRKVRS